MNSNRRGRRSRLPFFVDASLLVMALGLIASGAMLGRSRLEPDAAEHAGPWLEVTKASGETILRLPLAEEPRWEVHWVHSVAGILVRDSFRWKDGTMLLTDSRTPRLDVAGLGHIEGRGVMKSDGQGGYWIADLDEPIPGNAYTIRIGSSFAPTTIVHAGIGYGLTDEHAGERATIAVVTP
ncbi:MAG: DUF1850 domain-containing protein [Trueperaceae bacterium]